MKPESVINLNLESLVHGKLFPFTFQMEAPVFV
jgi:hypothetical protein